MSVYVGLSVFYIVDGIWVQIAVKECFLDI